MVDEAPLPSEPADGPVPGLGLRHRRILVVGASAGIGRSFAARAIESGGRVVVTSRRADRLVELVGGAEQGHGVAGDVRQPRDCARIVAEAVDFLGAIDLVVYSAGVAPLRSMVATTADDWASVLETHVLGLHHIIQAALGHLSPSAIVAVLSSETVGRPRSGLGAYGASKAALEESIRAWRMEHPRVRFATVAVGATFPTEFGDLFDPDLLSETLEDWTRHGLMTERMLSPDDVAGTLAGVLAAALDYPEVGLEHLVVRPNSPVLGASWSSQAARYEDRAGRRDDA
ncbi:MAG TPA: SDR family oxidoreductase [Acidimicrobiales bacterium]